MFFKRRPRVFVYPKPVDMRSSFERLSFFVREHHKLSIDEGSLFLFLGNNRYRLKILYFDGSGLMLLTKRMEKVSFMSIHELAVKAEITFSELKMILHGSVLREFYPEKESKTKRSALTEMQK